MNDGSDELAEYSVCCGNCGYCLRGLGARGRCPECGTDFDSESELVFYGWPAFSYFMKLGAPERLLAAAVLWCIVGIAIIFAWPRGATRFGPGGMAIGIGSILCSAWYLWSWTRAQPAAPPMQLRISSAGFGLRRGPGRISRTAWNEPYRVQVAAKRRGFILISIDDPTDLGAEGAKVHLLIPSNRTAAELSRKIEAMRSSGLMTTEL